MNDQNEFVHMNQMDLNRNVAQMGDDHHKKKMHQFCKTYHYHYIQMKMTDGAQYEGVLDGFDEDQVYLLMPIGEQSRQPPGDNRIYGGYGGFGGSGYPYRFRRFGRYGFPFYGIGGFGFPYFY